ncbi:MAG: T9SS type A sorting domain-containing protein [Saprospiraceae bacterium]
MKKLVFLLFILCAGTALFSQGQGQYKNLNIQVNGLLRQYRLYIPPGHDGTEPWPLVFVFHGAGVSLDWQVSISQMYLVADTAKFLVAYPLGRTVKDTLLNTYSGWLLPGYQPVGAPYDDVAFVSQMIDDVDAKPEYSVDRSRVFATGWSNGSELAFYLACELSDKIAAFAGVAGQLSNVAMAACTPSRKTSVLYMQGTSDIYVPSNGDAFYPPITDLPEFWANYDNCGINPDSTDLPNSATNDNSTVTFFDYPDCDEDQEVLFYRINGGGHNWPGGWLPPNFPQLLPINMDIHASVEIWDFFKRHKHPDIASTVENFNLDTKLHVFPNPTSDYLTIRLPNNLTPTNQNNIAIFDPAGRACLKATLNANETRINIGHLPPGLYFLELQRKEGRYWQKITVQ